MDQPQFHNPFLRIFLTTGLTIVLASCSVLAAGQPAQITAIHAALPTSAVEDTVTPFQPLPTATSTSTPTPVPAIKIFLPDWLPAGMDTTAALSDPFEVVGQESQADIKLAVVENLLPTDADFTWVFALVAPFATLTDNMADNALQAVWTGGDEAAQRLVLSDSTRAVFTRVWGYSNPTRVEVAAANELLEKTWQAKNTWAIVPFEEIVSRWKVLRVNGFSPFDRGLDLQTYPLAVNFQWQSQTPAGEAALAALQLAEHVRSNRDEQKLSRVVITGVTALVRSTAEKMELNGVDYPIGDIKDWLVDADITHISNEVSFYDQCPPALPVRMGLRFCSQTKYIQMLDDLDIDVVELTGNHLIDYGRYAFSQTLQMYADHGIQFYGGGKDLAASQIPLVIEDHGNRIAFIGCNRAGPPNDWATEDLPGSAPCDLDLMINQVKGFLDEGVLPIVTFQHYEVDQTMPGNQARQEMEKMSEAGAVIVSGSQAHFPHAFGFRGNNFIHYGLGNLFFDQMWSFNRREFIDRHIFYDGQYLGTEVLTAMLEDFARPRPMTPVERTKFLTEYFTVSGWEPGN